MKKLTLTTIALTACSLFAQAERVEMLLETDKTGAAVSPTMYGIFFEDINYASDGGLYGELVKNRSFEFPQPFMGWETFGGVALMDEGGPFSRNPHYVRLTPSGHREKWSGLQNEGYFGIGYREGEEYLFSMWARVPDGGKAKLSVELVNSSSQRDDQRFGIKEIEVEGSQWKKYTQKIHANETAEKGQLRIRLLHPDNTVDLEHISLFPVDTYKGRENGLRKDLATHLENLHPGVFRFPGGCIVEGTEEPDRYQWKNTVGPVENRPTNLNRWHYTFPWRFYPDYFQSNGLGFFEFFQFSEDIGAAPLPIINVGLVCQYQNDVEDQIPLDSIDNYIQDALDLIEFANGSADTPWGKVRSDMGHPEPFGLKYLGVGNEQWGPEYVERLEKFVKVLRKEHPEIKIVGSSGPNSEGKEFDYLWPEMRKLDVDLVDEHFYRPNQWFLAQGRRYDKYPRKGPKVFAGEYACHTDKKKCNRSESAVLEAAFMTGLERNADVVEMATYAPLFAHVDGWQWRPDLIWFDNLQSMPSASYLVQQVYGTHKGTHTVPLTMKGKSVAGDEDQHGLFASAVKDENDGTCIVKIVNTSATPHEVVLRPKGKKKAGMASAKVITIDGSQGDMDNVCADGTLKENIKAQESSIMRESDGSYVIEMPAMTFKTIIVDK